MFESELSLQPNIWRIRREPWTLLRPRHAGRRGRVSGTAAAGADLLQRRAAGRRFGPSRRRSFHRERTETGLQTGSAGRSAERAGLRGLQAPGSTRRAERGRRRRGQRWLPVVDVLPALGSPRSLSSDGGFLQALHGLHVALGLLQDLLGQFLGVQLSRGPHPLLLGLDRAVRLGAGLVRLGAADLRFNGPRNRAGKDGRRRKFNQI